ncbi:hypothetical protein WISP_123994 [Willisornis vidua]|uniref:Uncharacterized protein n=1 Tax=Willisornis vidua TaxID=1566151 RepID=A0ABQ9CRM6_9PASS|nr:hypothetical protein WISP_123994 [Willisornis vidua]
MRRTGTKGHFQVNCLCPYGGLQLARKQLGASYSWYNPGQKIPKNLEDKFMEQVLRELTRKDALLDPLLVNRMDLMSQVEIGGL